MTVLTCQSSSIIKNLIAKFSDQLHLEHVHKIHVVCIRKSDQQRKLQESQAIGGTYVGLINTCTVEPPLTDTSQWRTLAIKQTITQVPNDIR